MTKFSSKTNSLIILSNKINFQYSKVPEFIYFTKKEYLKDKNLIYSKIKKKFKKKEVIIRSSSLSEDNQYQSSAGKYKSFLNIAIEKKILFNKIKEVIKDFKNPNDQVIVQKYEKNILLSGVIFTRDPNSNAPYYIINFDKSGRTDLVTSGKYNPSSRTIVIYKKSKKMPNIFYNLIKVVKKIEEVFNSKRLDIEFAIEKKTKKILLFQCRKLSEYRKFQNFDKEIDITINNIKKKLIKIKRKNIYLPGSTTILSNMADWNPAEMIGSKPKNLSLSLYSELITNEIWAKQRFSYGYSNSSPNNLMLNLAGSPYIDLRTDFNSFIPCHLNKKIKNKIVNHSINRIKKNPDQHDKIEFGIISTCYDFSEDKNLKKILNKAEYSKYIKELKKLTSNILNNYQNFFKQEENKLKLLTNQIYEIKKSKLSHIQKIFYLVNDCKQNGTLPFAGLARLAFISTKILQTFVDRDILTTNQYYSFFNQLNTITRQMEKDYKSFIKKKKTKKQFIEKYGHLRPETYSISSQNYSKSFEKYFPKKINIINKMKPIPFKLNKEQLSKIKKLFKKNNFLLQPEEFFKFAKKSIELREWGKFIFTKSIDQIFNNLELLGKEVDIPQTDLNYISINTILRYNSNLDQNRIKNLLKKEILENKTSMKVLNQIKLPDLITSTNDVNFFYLDKVRGNFITNKSIYGKIKPYENIKALKEIKDTIVLIDNADPGFDFIFSYNIRGFITKYGGANSHMAIRCMELGIPAIIGIGEKNFESIRNKNSLFIDCDQKIFKILN